MNDLFLDHNVLFPKLNLLVENYDSIRKEYFASEKSLEIKDFTFQQSAYIQQNRKGFPITVGSYTEAKHKGEIARGWHVAAIAVNNTFYLRNSRYFPTLTEVLTRMGNVSVCAFNILDPGVSLDWHNDDEYVANSFRSLWIIDSPDAGCVMQTKCAKTGIIETKPFLNNRIYSFLHSTIHRVENMSDKPRIALAIDIAPTKSG